MFFIIFLQLDLILFKEKKMYAGKKSKSFNLTFNFHVNLISVFIIFDIFNVIRFDRF